MTTADLSIKADSKPAGGMSLLRLRDSRWRPLEFVVWIAIASLFFLAPTRLMLINEILILALFVVSIDLLLGYSGIVSLGHGAYFGLGAYIAGLMAKYGAGAGLWSDPLFGLVGAALVTGLFGFVTSFLVLRGADLTRIMVTLGIALIVEELANKLKSITGGSDGLQGVMPGPVLGMFEFDLYGRTAFVYSFSILLILFVLARYIVNSPFGLSLKAIKGNQLRSRAIGMPVNGRLVASYTIACTYAGIAGALLTQTTQFTSPDMVAFHRSADGLLILVFGGSGSLYGALIGSAAFRLMQDVIGNITPQYWMFWLGLVLVLLVLFIRGGIMGLLEQTLERVAPNLLKKLR